MTEDEELKEQRTKKAERRAAKNQPLPNGITLTVAEWLDALRQRIAKRDSENT
jgi:hypothetical protein